MKRSIILTMLVVPILSAALAAQPPAAQPPAAKVQPPAAKPAEPVKPVPATIELKLKVESPKVVVVAVPMRFVVYPWVAAAPMRVPYWWQYPWYAAPWWAYPWNTYWAVAYYPTPWGFWYLPPANYYYAPTQGYYPAQRTMAQAERPTETILANRSAESLYLEGYDRYFDGDARVARQLLNAAVERDANDARVWYIKALAEHQLGDEIAANASALRGAAVEYLNGSSKPLIAQSLERVQGDTRKFLRTVGTDLTVAKAKEIVAAPVRLATAK